MLTCPACTRTAEPALTLRDLAICGNCGATLVTRDGEVQAALHSDVQDLTPIELANMRAARGAIARPERKQQ